ncbi:MAG: glycosyltransferase family 4 protein [Methylocystis sp.]|nr:glycosyltransferase family 4 protein [Methylocystis sp.]
MNAPRIIFVNRFFYPDQSATSRILSDLAFDLARNGRQVHVITTRGRYDDPAADLPAAQVRDGVTIHRVYRTRFSRNSLVGRALDYIAMHVAFYATAWRVAAPEDRLVVKTDPPLLGVALAPLALVKRVKLVNWLQDIYPEIATALGVKAVALIAPILVFVRDAALKNARCNVVVGAKMRERVEAVGVAPERIEIIENWCDDDAIRPLKDNGDQQREKWGLRQKFVVAYSGNLGRAHEYQTLLGAAARLRAQQDIVFLFIGGGYLMNSLQRDITLRGLESSFRFLPYQPEDRLSQSLGAAGMHWLSQPPAMEGLIMPSKFYGIAAAGKPIAIIGDPCGELAARVKRFDCGAAIASGDDAALADFIQSMRNNPARAQEMGANARHMLEAHYARRQALDRWTRLLEEL